MPTFLHAADLHVDSPLVGLAAHDRAPVEKLRAATREAFTRLVDEAIRRRVSFVVLAGDVVDTDPLLDTALFVRSELQRLSRAGIPVAAVLGNHDCAGLSPGSLRLPEGVHVLPKDSARSVELVPGVMVHGRSYPRFDVREDLSLGYPAPVPGVLNVGLLHTALTGADGHAPYAPTTAPQLGSHGYQYWALGHVHRHEIHVEDGVPIVFPGNLQGRHARETGPRGAVLVSYEGDRTTGIERIFVDGVRWHHVELEVGADSGDVVERGRTAILEATGADREQGRLCAVRVSVRFRPGARGARGADVLRAALRGEVQEAGDQIWLEKVRVVELGERPDVSAAEAHLRELARTLGGSEPARRDLGQLLVKLRRELVGVDPGLADAFLEEGILAPERVESSAEAAESLLVRAIDVVMARLSEGGS
jgi:DNA repair exonuclease SbcCD nuclease subunit